MKPYCIPQMATKYVEYDMIQQHTDMPDFPDSRARLLFLFLQKNPGLNDGYEELYPLVTSLVQMGLDTHDMIDASGTLGMREMRSRQLKVLAGDYFSSRFYQLLSHAGQVETISSLSRAVCQVNEDKMVLYAKMGQDNMTAQEYLGASVQLKKTLFESFGSRIAVADQEAWTGLLESFAVCETMGQELTTLSKQMPTKCSYAYWLIWNSGAPEDRGLLAGGQLDEPSWDRLTVKYKVREGLLGKLDAALEQIDHWSVVYSDIRSDIVRMIDPFLSLVHYHRQVAREG